MEWTVVLAGPADDSYQGMPSGSFTPANHPRPRFPNRVAGERSPC